MNVNELAAHWLRHKEREGNAATTIQHYGDRIKRFTKEFGERNIKDIGREEVRTSTTPIRGSRMARSGRTSSQLSS